MANRIRILASTLILGFAALASNASATVIYGGGSFGINLDSQAGNTYTFTYTADFTSWIDSGSQDFIAAVNFKPNNGATPTSYSLLSTDAPGIWSANLANANNNGCSGGATSFICALADPLTSATTTTAATYHWTFKMTYASQLPASAFSDAPIRAWFVDENGKGSGLLSMTTDITTNVPEPTSIALLGIGILGLGLIGRRRSASLAS